MGVIAPRANADCQLVPPDTVEELALGEQLAVRALDDSHWWRGIAIGIGGGPGQQGASLPRLGALPSDERLLEHRPGDRGIDGLGVASTQRRVGEWLERIDASGAPPVPCARTPQKGARGVMATTGSLPESRFALAE